MTLEKRSIDRLRKDAKDLKKKENISHHEALDKLAKQHGYTCWKHLLRDYEKKSNKNDSLDLVKSNLSILSHYAIDYALLTPTETALNKSIIDAVGSVRIFFKTYEYHDYAVQLQGKNHKVVKEAFIVCDDDLIKTKVSLYRPVTKQGDPRIWIYQLKKYADPNDTIALILHDKNLYVINLNKVDLSIYSSLLEDIYRQNNSIAEDLLSKLRAIAQKGAIIPTRKFVGDTAIGMAIEEALGIEPNSSKKPDYMGIELKTMRQFSKTRSTIFAQVAEWKLSVVKSSAEMLDRYGYFRDGDHRLYCTVRAEIANPQGLFFNVDLEGDLLSESHEIDGGVLLWSGELLRKRLLEKHKETFWIEADSFINDKGLECFILKKIVHTKNPLLNQLLPLLKNGVITMDHLIKHSGKTNRVSEKGPLFKISPMNLQLLFPDPIYYKVN